MNLSLLRERSLRFRLRDATSGCHELLDRSFSRLDVSNTEDYRCFLGASAAALLPLEKQIEASGAVLDDWPARRRSPSLLDDCSIMDVTPQPLHIDPKPLSHDEMFGMIYVLEGSRLGAKLLVKALPAHVRAKGADSYLRHGHDTGLWQSFCNHLEMHAHTIVFEKAAAGAHAAFALFQKAADRHIVPEHVI